VVPKTREQGDDVSEKGVLVRLLEVEGNEASKVTGKVESSRHSRQGESMRRSVEEGGRGEPCETKMVTLEKA
jgi:hypothetical protein